MSRTAREGRWVLAATIIGSSMAFIDSTVVNVALPALQADLNATVVDIQWIVEGYILFLSALLLVGGSLGDKFGRRRIFAIGVTLFALASGWCGLAPNVSQLIVARAVQGVGGALLVPGSLAIIGDYFAQAERGRAIGTWSAFSAITTAVGPVLGGWLIENISWRWVFFINIPLAMVVLLILFWRVPESWGEGASGRLDWRGALLVTAGLGGLVYGLIESSNLGFSHPAVMGAMAGGGLALLLFVAAEAHHPNPMMPLHLFENRSFSGANLLTLFLYAALGGTLFFLPLNLIQVQDYSATAAGAVFLPFVLMMFLLSRWSGGLVERYGARRPLIVGPIITAAGYVWLAWAGIDGSYWRTFFPAITILGLGMALSVAPLTTTVLSTVPRRHSGLASGINNAVSRVAGLLAIAVLGIVALLAFNRSLDEQLAGLTFSSRSWEQLEAERVKLAGASVPDSLEPALKPLVGAAIDRAFVTSFRIVVLISAGLALLSALLAQLMIE